VPACPFPEYTIALRRFVDVLAAVAKSKDFQDVLGDSFVASFCEAQPQAADLFTSMASAAVVV
jgi:hypothetical protein